MVRGRCGAGARGCRPEAEASKARCGRGGAVRACARKRRGGRGRCAGQWRAARAADARTAVSSRSPPCPARASPAPPDSMAYPTATITRSHALTTVRITVNDSSDPRPLPAAPFRNHRSRRADHVPDTSDSASLVRSASEGPVSAELSSRFDRPQT